MKRLPIISTYQENQEIQENLVKRVNELMDSKKGVLCLDEHHLAYDFFCSLLNRTNDWENRRLIRQFLISPPLQEEFTAVLLSEEFIKQSDDEAVEFFDLLIGKNLRLGVRLDLEVSSTFGSGGEYMGTSVDTMVKRFHFYREKGCVYSKWRSVFQIKDNSPTLHGSERVCQRLAKYAALSQKCGLVPIISVEVVPDGSEDIFKARMVLEKLMINLMKAMNDFDVILEATILQVSFVQPGRLNIFPVVTDEVADETLDAFKKSLPIAIGGVMFHSSGFSEEDATQTLNHIIIKKEANESMMPWRMTYSFGRAQKASALLTWGGDPDSEVAGQRELMKRAKANNQALLGEYSNGSAESPFSDQDLYVPNYIF